MGLAEQEEVKRLAERFGAGNLIVVFGVNQPATLRIMTRTFREGDPGYAGPLAGVALGLPCYHILELREQIPPEVWQREMGMYELEIDGGMRAAIVQAMDEARGSRA